MSFVPNATMASAMTVASPFDMILGTINTNPYFIGMTMLLLNLGGRFLGLEMSKGQETFFQNQWVRRLLIYIIIFVGTRNILVAFILGSIIILAIGYLFNENSSLCIFKVGVPGSSCAEGFAAGSPMPMPPVAPLSPLTPEEQTILQTLQAKQAGRPISQAPPMPQMPQAPQMPQIPQPIINPTTTYNQNMMALQGLRR
jgi:hypothetical protein